MDAWLGAKCHQCIAKGSSGGRYEKLLSSFTAIPAVPEFEKEDKN